MFHLQSNRNVKPNGQIQEYEDIFENWKFKISAKL